MLDLDKFYRNKSEFLTGIDEAGRGPLAGPLVVAAVTVKSKFELPGLNDSKKLGDLKRREFFMLLPELVEDYSIVIISVQEIEENNILQATLQGMEKTITGLKKTGRILVDGNRLSIKLRQQLAEAVVKGDQRVSAIAAASILAKVTRDNIMHQLAVQYPGYGFEKNKGYGTKEHLKAINDLGITPVHRRNYAPIAQHTIIFE